MKKFVDDTRASHEAMDRDRNTNISGDNRGGRFEEDETVDRMRETLPNSRGQLKTPEDECADIVDTSDSHGEKKDCVQQNNNGVETSSSQKGTIAEIPDENATYSGQEDSAVGSDRNASVRGVMFVPGPAYTGRGIHTGYQTASDDDTINNEADDIIQGFLPEDDPRRKKSNHEILEERVQRLIDNAITLDDSAVQPIPLGEDGDVEENRQNNSRDDEAEKSDNRRWYAPLLGLVIGACIILAIALPLSLRGKPENEVQDTTVSFSADACLKGEVDVRFVLAKSILSSITSPDLLDDESTPQGKAIRWIVCDDSISVQLLDNQDPSTGNLPKQKHGFRFGGVSGEAQVTRRWHRNYTRENFPYGDFDPVGVHCLDGEFVTDGVFLLDDYQKPIPYLIVNMRIPNGLNGLLPPEFGYLMDCKNIMLDNHISLTGQLPQTMGNMSSLISVVLIFNGLGGELPGSLFRLKKLRVIRIVGILSPTTLSYNTTEGELEMAWRLPSNVGDIEDTQLKRIVLQNSFVGKIPSWIAKLKRLEVLNLQMNNFEGAIPEAIGDLPSLYYLNLLGNNLTDTIPSSLGKLDAMEVLILGNNQLQGELPASIGNLRKLQLLDM
eukprot:scaffold654_cov148-Skeletonema_menzelii.AAC.1